MASDHSKRIRWPRAWDRFSLPNERRRSKPDMFVTHCAGVHSWERPDHDSPKSGQTSPNSLTKSRPLHYFRTLKLHWTAFLCSPSVYKEVGVGCGGWEAGRWYPLLAAGVRKKAFCRVSFSLSSPWQKSAPVCTRFVGYPEIIYGALRSQVSGVNDECLLIITWSFGASLKSYLFLPNESRKKEIVTNTKPSNSRQGTPSLNKRKATQSMSGRGYSPTSVKEEETRWLKRAESPLHHNLCY
eukprot:1158664-Pelagomonas_calceolata.AAC.1